MENVRQTEAAEAAEDLPRVITDLERYQLQHGVKILAPAGDHISKWYRRGVFYEAGMLEHIRRTYGTGLNVVDVGAHIGGHALYFSKVCGAAKVFAIEPNPQLFALLEKNLQMNDLCSACVKALHCAAGAEDTWALLKPWPEGNTGMAGVDVVDDPFDPQYAARDLIRMRTLDQLLMIAGRPKIDLLKIDVEGSGTDVLRGAAELIGKQRPAIFIECQTDGDLVRAKMELQPHEYRVVQRFNHTPTYEFRAD